MLGAAAFECITWLEFFTELEFIRKQPQSSRTVQIKLDLHDKVEPKHSSYEMPEKQKTNQRGSGRKTALCKQCLKKKKKRKNSAIKLKFPLRLPWGFQKETLRETWTLEEINRFEHLIRGRLEYYCRIKCSGMGRADPEHVPVVRRVRT